MIIIYYIILSYVIMPMNKQTRFTPLSFRRPHMNTQKIKAFLTSIELGSLTAAGEELGYTQPAMTQMMRSLEQEIGFPLLFKSRTGVEPTMESQMLIPAMKQLVDSEERLFQEADEIMGIRKGTIRLGSFASTSIHWLPQVLDHFQNHYPDIVFDITECGEKDMIRGLLSGTMDAALMSSPGNSDIEFIPVSEEPMYVVFSEKFDLGRYDRVPIDALNDYPLILEAFDQDTYSVFEKAGIEPAAKYFSKDCVAILSMVQQGVGVSVLPALIVDLFPGEYEYRPLEPESNRTLGIGIRSKKSCGPLTRVLIRYIQNNIT